MYAQIVCVYVGSDMNNQLEDLMLEYLLRKKLNMASVEKAPKQIKKLPRKRQRTALGRHNWTEQDAHQIAFLYRQGKSHGDIAKAMGMRTSQVSGAIRAMSSLQIPTTLPRLLMEQS